MTFSQEWEQRYQRTGPTSLWPWSDLVRLFRRHCPSREGRALKVLELGCGSGANIPFFLSEGADYYAIEGSSTIVGEVLRRFPELAGKVRAGDFTEGLPFECAFDVVVDRSSLTHNDTSSILRTVDDILRALANGGIYVGIDWFADGHSELRYGRPLEDDPHTFHAFSGGLFRDVGRVHASSEAHLRSLFHEFDLLWLEKKTLQQYAPDADVCHVTWNIVASKR